jgi:hypothetical protein
MLPVLLGLFVLVMLGGIGLAMLERHGRALPLKVSVTHGLLGVLGIVLLVMQALDHPDNHAANMALVVFILTALGGLLLFAFRASRQRLPLGVVMLHGLFALAGLALLTAGWLRAAA